MRAARAACAEVRRLGGHVQARGDAVAVERSLVREALTNRGDDRHLPAAQAMRRTPSEASARSFTSYRSVVAIDPLFVCHQGSGRVGREQALVLALLPTPPRPG